MNEFVEWKFWSAEHIVKRLPLLLTMVRTSVEDFSPEHWEKNAAAIEVLTKNAPTADEIRSYANELITLGFALDLLAVNIVKKNGNLDESLRLFQAAHELFRGGNSSLHPTRPMRQALNDGIRAILQYEIAHIKTGELAAGNLLETLNDFVIAAWGEVPPQLTLSMNEMLLNHLERARTEGQNDTTFHERFVRDNIETVLALEVPTSQEKILDRWQEIGEHVAPIATRNAVRTIKRPRNLSTLLPPASKGLIQQALEQGDVNALGTALRQVEDELATNLRLRLTPRLEYCEPNADIRFRGQPDRYFVEARDLLRSQTPSDALRKFQNIHFNKPGNPLAKEWYAYALSRFGVPSDINEIIPLLEDAINSPSFRPELNWTARWNLACALRRFPSRAHEALDALLPVLENGEHGTAVFELCLLWALDQERGDVLATLLRQSPFYEAHLLATLYYIEAHPDGEIDAELRDHFRCLSRILQDPDYVFPNPIERLQFNELQRLTRSFIETSLVAAGTEWFRQRVSFPNERRNWKNWECAGQLYERAGDLPSAWRCFRSQWRLSANNGTFPRELKARALRSLLTWAEKNGFENEALPVLRQDWQKTSMNENDVRMFELKLAKTPPSPPAGGKKEPPVKSEPQPDLVEAEQIIQRLAGSFMGVSNAALLAAKADEAQQLISATIVKHAEMPTQSVAPISEVIRLAQAFQNGVNDQQAQDLARQMRDQLAPLQSLLQSQKLPFEISGLAQACSWVIQSFVTRARAVPDMLISPPESLKLLLDTPGAGETYQTRILTRLTNPSAEEMRDIQVTFTTSSPHVHFLTETVSLADLGPAEKTIVEGTLLVSDGVEESVGIRIHVSYQSGGITRTSHQLGHVPARSIGLPIPVKQRYMTGTPVTVERTDLFHGRDKELKDLLSTFVGGRLLRLYFVNGIRRVGKSTLMTQLSGQCGNETLALLLNLQEALGDSRMNMIQLVRQLIRKTISLVEMQLDLPRMSLSVPGAQDFEMDPPWVVFEDFLENMRRQAQRQSILICFDEVQYLIERIAHPDSPMKGDDAFLSWLRGKVQTNSHILVICTGSEPYATMRKRYEHTLWGNMEAYNVSFVEKAAMEKIAALPVKPDGVVWLPEAIDRLWDMTEGHPWLTQALAEKVTEGLNAERRRLVGPADVERAVEIAMQDERYSSLWWNEEEHQVTPTHRQIAFLILQQQAGSRLGLPESELYSICQKSGIRTAGRYLDEMRVLEVLTDTKRGNDLYWRIKGGFLEKYLTTLMHREAQEQHSQHPTSSDQPLALMLDWENIKISLLDVLKEQPAARAQSLFLRLNGAELATRLLAAASRHGIPRQKWAVANWDRATFAGDQAALRRANYMPDMAGVEKADASDHVLREKIHYVLREQPEINTYIIGTGDADFGEVIKTLQEKGKHVVLWATKKAISDAYKHHLTGPDRIQIEWLEDILFEAEQASA